MRKFAFLIFLLPVVAAAQPTELEITPFIGFGAGGEITVSDSLVTGNRPVDVDLSRGGTYGLRFNHPMSRRPALQLEMLIGVQETQIEDVQRLFGEIPSGPVDPDEPSLELLDMTVSYIHGGAAWEVARIMQPYEIRPYVVGSLGLTHIDSNTALGDDQRPSVSAGVGFRWVLQPRFALRLESRGFWTFTDDGNTTTRTFTNPDCPGGTCIRTYGFTSNFYQLNTSLGLSWSF